MSELGVTGLTVTEVKGFGRQKVITDSIRRRVRRRLPGPKVKVEVVHLDALTERAIEAMVRPRDGKIGERQDLVTTVEQVIALHRRIGEAAVQRLPPQRGTLRGDASMSTRCSEFRDFVVKAT